LEVEVEEEEEEMDNQRMNGHDSSSEKHDVHDNQEGEAEGKIDLFCGMSLMMMMLMV
jgi:hypothetical protein